MNIHFISYFHLQRCILPLILLLPFFANSQNFTNLGSSHQASPDPSPWIISPSGDFALGFRRLDGQNLYLLSIWFDKIPSKTLVWYANGDNPAPEGSRVELSNNGLIILRDPQNQVIWSRGSSPSNVSYATLLDTGNLILSGRDSLPVWQSFHEPADTILPTQVLEAGGKLISKSTGRNFSMGRFELRLLGDGNLVLNTKALPSGNAYAAYYVSNTFDSPGWRTSNRVVFNESGYIHVVKSNGDVVNLTSGNMVSARDFYFRATLDYNGVFTQYAHPKSSDSWFSVWFVPGNICRDMPNEIGGGSCGFNSYCLLDDNRRPYCRCIPGFNLSDPENDFGGCQQNRVQRCDLGDSRPEDLYEMRQLNNIFWPESANYEELQSFNEDACMRTCFSDCNCVVSVIVNGSICYKKKLPLSNGRNEQDRNGKAFVKVLISDLTNEDPLQPREVADQKKWQIQLSKAESVLLGGSAFLNMVLLSGVIFLLYSLYHRKRKFARSVPSLLETNVHAFTYQDLKEATSGFNEELGRGAFGTVYLGHLPSSISRIPIAVKRLDRVLQDGEKEFRTEAMVIAKTHHKNLVRLIGYCDEGPNKLLVYEYMSNGTLAGLLFGDEKPTWRKRIEIASGIARGLVYLHEECSSQIIHCDIKPQNILLDDSLTAKISDFGLAKLLINEQTRTLTAIRGTKGYVAPEWFRSMPITAKVDVYSYGVMLLEIICCRKNVEMDIENEEEAILTDWVYDCYKEGRLHYLSEYIEESGCDKKEIEKLVMVAIWCIHEDPSIRPSMNKVMQMLEGVIEVPKPPPPSPFSSVIY